MALLPLFSRRKRLAENGAADVFSYDGIPAKVRVQLLMIMEHGAQATRSTAHSREGMYQAIVKELREELGTYCLVGERYVANEEDEFSKWFVEDKRVHHLLDAVELWYIMTSWAASHKSENAKARLSETVAKLNARLREAGIGYELVDGRIMEKSNEFVHQEAVLPALNVLSEMRFANANSEFRKAFDAYKAADYEACLVDCLKAFESVMKVIAAEEGWGLPETATAKPLIAALFENEYIPGFMQSQFNGLRTMLESSVPTTRNKVGGHGKGVEVREVPKSLAAFQLHQTAAIIVFLANPNS